MSQCGLELPPVQRIRPNYLDVEGMPDIKSGVYAFWCKEAKRYIYIGQTSSSIKKRLKQHLNPKNTFNPKLKKRIKYFGQSLEIQFTQVEKGQLNEVEKHLIKVFKPLANRDHNPNYQ